ncbi:MAG: pyridoxamine 5-phosphate oxidase [Gaiellaceae bacterium]|nr:pyridoxamine 5-phosphate oxidase [Gaiellaceae bacterium]
MSEHSLESVDPDPLRQFEAWFREAGEAGIAFPEAAAVATASAAAVPSVRMVLVKGADERGLDFYTNYRSRKGRELEENPRAALLFHWAPLGRQVRVEGPVARVPAEESDAYFSSRPRGSRLAAIASRQSEPLESRAEIEAVVADLERSLDGRDPERPEQWGGFRLVPERWEFWQHGEDRLHDRVLYERDGDSWGRSLLFP